MVLTNPWRKGVYRTETFPVQYLWLEYFINLNFLSVIICSIFLKNSNNVAWERFVMKFHDQGLIHERRGELKIEWLFTHINRKLGTYTKTRTLQIKIQKAIYLPKTICIAHIFCVDESFRVSLHIHLFFNWKSTTLYRCITQRPAISSIFRHTVSKTR